LVGFSGRSTRRAAAGAASWLEPRADADGDDVLPEPKPADEPDETDEPNDADPDETEPKPADTGPPDVLSP
jgi:hypothetical protein